MDLLDNPQKTNQKALFVMILAPFFSIIIPVFRAKEYISRCIQSCLDQSFTNFEIILVDDCGEDETIQIAKKYAKLDSRITILYNPANLGAFHSRLKGIKQARGEYILFVDCDDFIATDTLIQLYSIIQAKPVDIVHFRFAYFPSHIYKPSPRLKNLSLNNPFIYQTLNTSSVFQSICDKVFKTKYAKLVSQKLSFIQKPFSCMEDGLFFLIASFEIQSYISLNKIFYFYQYNPQSTTKLVSQHSFEKKLKDFQNGLEILQTIKTLYPQYIKVIQKYEQKIISAYILEGRKYTIQDLQKILDLIATFHFVKQALPLPSAYFKSTILSLRYFYRWQTLARIGAYLLTFGKIKL